MKYAIHNDEPSQQPLLFCKLICRYPKLIFVLFTCLHVGVFTITAVMYVNDYDVFPVNFETLPLYLFNDAHLKELTWMSKTHYEGHVHRPQTSSKDSDFDSTRTNIGEVVEVIYEHPRGGNLLEQGHLKLLSEIEDRIFYIPDYQSSFCHINHHACSKPQSILRLFDGTFSHIDTIFNNTQFNNIQEVIFRATLYEETSEFLNLFIGKDSIVSKKSISTRITRSFIPTGLPFGRMHTGLYGTKQDLIHFLIGNTKAELEKIKIDLSDSLHVYYFSRLMHEHDVFKQAVTDAKLAIGSLAFIFVFICIQTRSVFITTFGIISILSSFLITNLIYRFWLEYVYFGFFHLVSMFLILGIGADDLFIFHDTWRMYDAKKDKDISQRLSDCYRRAAKTTFVTSLTTMTAFFVSGLSPLLPVKTFGIFSGLLVVINYILVLTYFPVLLVFYHTVIRVAFKSVMTRLLKPTGTNDKRKLTCYIDGRYDPNQKNLDVAFPDTQDVVLIKIDVTAEIHHVQHIDITNKSSNTSSNNVNQSNIFSISNAELKKKIYETESFSERTVYGGNTSGIHTRFIRGFFLFITNKYVRLVVPVLLLGVSAFFAHRISKLEPDTQEIRLFKHSHNYARATSIHYSYFRRNFETENQRLYLVWGMLPADISACNQQTTDYCPGQPRWDETFDISGEATQVAMASLCKTLHDLDVQQAADLRISQDVHSGLYKISCFTEDMDAFFQKETIQTDLSGRYTGDLDLNIPVSPDNVSRFMETHSDIYPDISPGRQRPLETLVSYWLANGYTGVTSPDFLKYNHLLGEQMLPNVTQAVTGKHDYYYGTRLQYLAIEINTTMNLYSIGYQEGLHVYEAWDEFVNKINSDMPIGLSRGVHVTQNLWHWVHVKKVLANSAIMGIVIGLCSAWPILVLTTSNFIIGTLAVVTIGLVTACVVGMIPLVGWKLGVLESINLCMVVGLSVDYIVHLAEAYRMSKSEKRLDKVRDMLESIGLSVVSGAVTTVGAAVFMLFAEIQFLYQFGIFIITTVGISLFFSLFGFSAILAICGPEGSTGSIYHVMCKLKRRVLNSDVESSKI